MNLHILNSQKPEPIDKKGNGEFLDVHSVFYTLQGEGPFTGHPAVFVRLAGCNLQCPGCDTEYTQGREKRHISWIVGEVGAQVAGRHHVRLVVITGGEPFRQMLYPLVGALINVGYRVQIESNGALPFRGVEYYISNSQLHRQQDLLQVIISPKTNRIHEDAHRYARAFKYVLRHDDFLSEDGLPIHALGHKAFPHIERPRPGMPVYVNPEDSKDDETNRLNLQAVRNVCLEHGYTCGVQLHKLLDLA